MKRLYSAATTIALGVAVVLTISQRSFSTSSVSGKEPIEFPAPTGPYGIGRSVFNWTDASRPEVMTDEPNDNRELVVYLWYPAGPSARSERAPYIPDLATLKKVIRGPEANFWQSVQTHTVTDAPMAAAPSGHPILLLSHGNRMNSTLYSFLIEELVSQGYVVAGIDHPYDARGVVLSGGKVAGFGEEKWPKLKLPTPATQASVMDSEYERFYRKRVDVRAADASFVLNQLEQLNAEKPGTRFSGRFDLTRPVIIGHSVGGVAAGRACQTDQRFKACINLDGQMIQGPFYFDEEGKSFAQPLLFLTKPFLPSDEKLAEWKLTRQEWEAQRNKNDDRLFSSVRSGSYRVTISGATHQSFSDDRLLVAMLIKPQDVETGRRLAKIVRDYTVAFLDKVVKGKDAALLDGASRAYPEVMFERWKPAGDK